ncbi:MAG: pyridoxal phosphate-dependent aminotransferase family protein [Bacteroidetes bacterium]|nr:pyridoxal phosphate-dependent aminotransferase family protein [Bacteroidota bacterium]
MVDFCSNDYLSFARSQKINYKVRLIEQSQSYFSGATGARSISGNSVYAEELEKYLANFHHAEAGLLFNSGYDANVGLFSSIAKKEDSIICDELIHASIIDGCRLGYANRFRFAHNNLDELEKKLDHAKGNVFVAVESVYSMDGDMADLKSISAICKKYNAHLIVDEAHATGIFGHQGRGLVCQLGLEREVFARVHTFGKALGCHGAIVIGAEVLRNYLINFARSFMFTTALPMHSLIQIKTAYEEMDHADFDNSKLHLLIALFRKNFQSHQDVFLIDSFSPVQSVVIPGSARAKKVAAHLQKNGFDVRAIVSPSVPQGKERLRISMHQHNSEEEVMGLLERLHEIMIE